MLMYVFVFVVVVVRIIKSPSPVRAYVGWRADALVECSVMCRERPSYLDYVNTQVSASHSGETSWIANRPLRDAMFVCLC